MKTPIIVWGATAAALVLMTGAAQAAPDYRQQAEELARLRGEVEALDRSIDEKTEETRARLTALRGQRASLEAEVQREELRLEQLKLALGKVQERVRDAGQMQRSMKPAVMDAIAQVQGAMTDGLPFRVEERVADLERLREELENDTVVPAVALSRLWNRVEDELRLTRENGMYQQVIAVDGEEVLADVARIGMVMLFFRTPDKRYGTAVRNNGAWSYRVYSAEEDQRRTAVLFESLEKRVRVGFFELPNALEGSP